MTAASLLPACPVIAFLGTGLMGAPMVRRLAGAGYRVHVWNRSYAKAAMLADCGAVPHETAAGAIETASIVCLCLTDADAVEDVLFGGAGIAASLRASAIVIDFSTIGPIATRAIAARLTSCVPGVRWLDAPVTGGVQGAESGQLVLLCGGDDDAIAAVQPVFAPLAKRVCHLGAIGQGQAAKICNQLIVTINVLAIAEALALAKAQGLDPARLPDALAGGWADSPVLQIIGRRMAEGVAEPKIVAIDAFAKDAALARDCSPPPARLAARSAEIYRAALAGGLGHDDATALFGYLAGDGQPA